MVSYFYGKATGTDKQQRYEIAHDLKKPWTEFVKTDNFDHGRSTDTANEPVLETLYNLLLNYKLLRSKLTDLSQLVTDLIKSERATETQFLL